jgi:hypothetical protein
MILVESLTEDFNLFNHAKFSKLYKQNDDMKWLFYSKSKTNIEIHLKIKYLNLRIKLSVKLIYTKLAHK